MQTQKIETFFARLAAAIPSPKTELNYSTPYELLVAVALSAHTTDKSVNKATARLFPVANTPAAIAQLGVDGVREYIRTVGLYNTKAAHMVRAAEILLAEHQGEVPRSREALEALPGVGRKTANVILNTAFGELAMAVDTHIFRVSNRTGLAPGKTPRAVEKGLLERVPPAYLKDGHHLLILHGRYTCMARTPKCGQCPVQDLCDWPDKPLAGKPKP
ncbi:endonuclease III [Thermithiobacillus plumbiphilus]|uniref:Endonuclease III n=1 Tax=Thermithiobacillus plumbiphilus TaxID=1729899 RepID=A0ABU9D5J5_9PROT